MRKFILFIIPLVVTIIACIAVFIFLDKRENKGALQVTSNPKSQVYLNGKLIGDTTLCLCRSNEMLSAGDYSIKLVAASGVKPFEEKISITRGTLTVVDRTFNESNSEGSIVSLSRLKSKKDAEIFVTSIPEGSNIFLDNNPVGNTPLLLKNISEKDYDIRVTHKGYKDKLIKVRATTGYKLISMTYLGINPVVNLILKKVLILDTPLGFLRVREESSANSSQIGQVNPGETYELLEENEEWFKIKLNDGKSGWISSSYAEIYEPMK